ncbi:MAG TPA: dTDP-4-dehydrorhamnose reductase [Chloroflexota bacterium]|nr:dTDP-4-dehydrorhamnose reductase [Chloroflexota bacterium]
MYDRVLITGGNGLLGTKTIELMLAQGRHPLSVSLEPEVLNRFLGEFPYYPLDITDAAAVRELVGKLKPDAVIHTAAFTAVDACESQRELSRRVNVDGTANVAAACREAGIRLAHVSTEYVFDGKAGPYREEDEPHPISHYGLTKLESEKAVRENCSDWVIGRTTVLFGRAPNVRPSFVAWLVDKLEKREPVRIVDDQIGSPTLADNLAQMLLALLDSDRTGIYNTVGDSIIDRHAFSVVAADIFGLDPTLIQRIKTSELNQPAPRPLKAGLVMEKFKRDFPGVPVLTARQSLELLKSQMGR